MSKLTHHPGLWQMECGQSWTTQCSIQGIHKSSAFSIWWGIARLHRWEDAPSTCNPQRTALEERKGFPTILENLLFHEIPVSTEFYGQWSIQFGTGPGESGVWAVYAIHTILDLTFGKVNEELRSLLETLVLWALHQVSMYHKFAVPKPTSCLVQWHKRTCKFSVKMWS